MSSTREPAYTRLRCFANAIHASAMPTAVSANSTSVTPTQSPKLPPYFRLVWKFATMESRVSAAMETPHPIYGNAHLGIAPPLADERPGFTRALLADECPVLADAPLAVECLVLACALLAAVAHWSELRCPLPISAINPFTSASGMTPKIVYRALSATPANIAIISSRSAMYIIVANISPIARLIPLTRNPNPLRPRASALNHLPKGLACGALGCRRDCPPKTARRGLDPSQESSARRCRSG